MAQVSWGYAAQLFVFALVLGTTYAAMAMSWGIIFSTTGTFHLAHSITYTVSAYVLVEVVSRLHLPLVIGGLVAIVGAGIFGVLLDYLVYGPLRRAGASSAGIFLAALGIVTAGQALFQIIFGAIPIGIENAPLTSYQWGPVSITNFQLFSTVSLAVSMGLIWVFVNKTRTGHAITAVRTNTGLARGTGIPVRRVFVLVFFIGSALAAEVAFFDAGAYQANTTMGMRPVLFGFIGVFLGGVESLLGSALGGFLTGFVIVMSGLIVSSQGLGIILAFLILIVVLVFRPQGIVGKTNA